ncbi:hypothetical protein [Asticcacaulis tiandongensis]|uniref:hypothetical protein n=1 Tax=Asticcacaulis tiandongensis TaxID=2565365 RepID=UPI001128F587|nr:hypothetical protein [Asticcacaulis tiandongensis]
MSGANTLSHFVFGTHKTHSFRLTAMAVGAICAVLASLNLKTAGYEPALWQWGLLWVLAFDLGGGMIAVTRHERLRHAADHEPAPLRPVGFACLHIHPLIAAACLPGLIWPQAILLWVTAVAATLLVAASADQLKRGLSLGLCALCLILMAYMPQSGWQWLAPVYLLKLIVAPAVNSKP